MAKVHGSRYWIGAVFVCALSVSCAGLQRGKFTIVDRDFDAIAEMSLKKIDPHETITTIVVPADTDPRARKALSRLRTVVTPAQVPASNDVILPSGYFLLHTFRAELDGALFEGQMGPVTRKLTKANLQDCGRIYSVPLFLKDSDWYNPNYKVATCDEKRIWWPADETPPNEALTPQQNKPALS